jgi:hypothetical protein
MNGQFFFKKPFGNSTTPVPVIIPPIITPPIGTIYSFGTPSYSFSAVRGDSMGLFAFDTGYTIPSGVLGTVSIGASTINGVFGSSGFVPSNTLLSITSPLGVQPYSLSTTNLSSNLTYSGSITILPSTGSTPSYSFGSLVGVYSAQQGQALPVIAFTGGNLPLNTAVNFILPLIAGGTSILTGVINSGGSFISTVGQIIPAGASLGSQSITLSTTSLSSNINTTINLSVISSSTTIPVQLNKAIIFGTNGEQYTVLDLNTNTAIGPTINSIASYGGGNYTKQIVRNAVGSVLYKLDQAYGLVKLNWNNSTNVLTFVGGVQTTNSVTAHGLAYSEIDNLAFVASKNISGNSQLVINVINTTTMSILNTLYFPIHEYNNGQLAFDSVNKRLYVNGRRTGGEACILRVAINTTNGASLGTVQWDFIGGGYTGWGLGLNRSGDKLVASIPSLSGVTGNVLILNTSQFNAGNTVYSFQGTPPPTTLPNQSLTGVSGQLLNISIAGDRYVIGSGALLAATTMGQIGVGINTSVAPTQSESVGLTPNGDKMVQIGYGSSTAQIRNFTGALQGTAIATVNGPQAIIAL